MKDRDTNLKKMRDNFFVSAGWDDLSFEEWEESMDNFFEESVRVLKHGGSMIVFMAIIKVESIIKIAERHGLYYKTRNIFRSTRVESFNNPAPSQHSKATSS